MKTYEGWILMGRVVRKGEKAKHRIWSPDGTESRAVFSEGQTEELVDRIALEGWSRILPIEAETPKDSRPVVKIRTAGERVQVWVGPDKKAIETLRKASYSFDRYTNRWTAKRNIAKVVHGFEARGYRVVVEDTEPTLEI